MSAHLSRAHLLLQQSRYELAERELRQALAGDPTDAVTHAMLGICVSEQAREAEAIQLCRRGVELGPDQPFCHYALAVVLHNHDRYDPAMEAVDEAIRLDPYQADAHALRGQLHLHNRDWQQAADAAEQGLSVDAEHVAAANVRAVALTQLGRRDEAGATIDAALARNPDDAFTHANRGWTLLHDRQPHQAMEHFAESLRLDPNLEWARAGIVEAMKARNPLYRWLLAYFLWMSRLKHRTQWMLLIGLLLVVNLSRGIGQSAPALAAAATGLILAYALLVFTTWMGVPLFNLLLRLNRFGRLAMSDQQRRDSTWFGLALALVVLAIGIDLVSLGIEGYWMTVPYLFLMLAVSATVMSRPGQGRRISGALTLALFAAASYRFYLGTIDVQRDSEQMAANVSQYIWLGTVVVWGSVATTWLSAILRDRR